MTPDRAGIPAGRPGRAELHRDRRSGSAGSRRDQPGGRRRGRLRRARPPSRAGADVLHPRAGAAQAGLRDRGLVARRGRRRPGGPRRPAGRANAARAGAVRPHRHRPDRPARAVHDGGVRSQNPREARPVQPAVSTYAEKVQQVHSLRNAVMSWIGWAWAFLILAALVGGCVWSLWTRRIGLVRVAGLRRDPRRPGRVVAPGDAVGPRGGTARSPGDGRNAELGMRRGRRCRPVERRRRGGVGPRAAELPRDPALAARADHRRPGPRPARRRPGRLDHHLAGVDGRRLGRRPPRRRPGGDPRLPAVLRRPGPALGA